MKTERERARTNLRLFNVLTFMRGFSAFEAVAAVYFTSIVGSMGVAMIVLTVMNVTASACEIPTGVLSDWIGRKKTLVLSFCASALAAAAYALATDTTLLFVGSVLFGVALSLMSGTDTAFVYENVESVGERDQFKKYEGHRRALGRYALVFSAVIGGVCIYFSDMHLAVAVTAGVYALAAIGSLFLSDIREHVTPFGANVYAHIGEAWRVMRQDRVLWHMSVGTMLSDGVGNVEYRVRALLFALVMPTWAVSVLGGISNLASGLGMKYAHTITNRVGDAPCLVHANILGRGLNILLTVTNSVYSGVIMSVSAFVTFGVRTIAAEDILQGRYTVDQRATMGSLVGLGKSAVYSVAGVAVGFLADGIGIMYTMILLQVVLIASAGAYAYGLRVAKDPKVAAVGQV